ncbi:MAG: sodium-dependent transporter [Methylococcales symbiont of Hymedesmia sp. n. MRB-2018]|nr:MAG: sodium-dependent transporter [Methylococcales symbiont of Hymedesmia sp. n. MRB-2018]KAF3984050.1 MAG: sodium-dependent transporter [Methylococcales symbiont of Hymedesmia sp. n. MRB-2018]
MANTKSIHGEWSSRFAYILATTGSAVGLGNIWKFPYITGENGGGAFVLVYLGCVLAIGIPIMIAETMMGRRGRQSPINTLSTLSTEANASKYWRYLGWTGVIAGILILSYYSVIAGWAIAYVFKAIFSGFSSDAAIVNASFDDLIASPVQLIAWHSIFMVATMTVVMQGVKGGLEKAVQLLMPTLLVLLLLLVAYAMSTGEYFFEGLSFLFHPDFSKISSDAVLTAMGHAFFTLGLGMGAIMVYGSYLQGGVSIAKTTLYVAGADTIVALLAGIAIFPLVFANGLEPGSGPGLIFQTLPIAFGNMTGGWLFGILFFVLLVFAALTSSISLVEPMVAWLIENRGFTRVNASVISGGAIWALGVSVVLSFNVWSDFKIFDKTIFELLDYLTANLMLPIGGFCIAVFAGWVMQQRHVRDELALPEQQYRIWKFLIRYVAPTSVFIVFLHVLGLF